MGDASALNGAFKIHLTKAKHEYIEKRGAPKFKPTDIVPLVNYAFPRSFGNTKSAANVIASRGWNLLEYNLLPVVSDPSKVVDLTNEDDGDMSAIPCPPFPLINITQGAGNRYLDILIEEEKKDEGRKRKFEEIKSLQKTKNDKIEHLKRLLKVSSATLAANNHYVLDENVHDLVFVKHQAVQAAQAAVDERRRMAQEKKTQSLQNAFAEFTTYPNVLTVPEMKALVSATTTTTDSPVKSKKAELQAQLYREPRYGRVQAWANDIDSPLLVIPSPQLNQWMVMLFKDFLLLLLMILVLPLLP